jgi:hypothetical protein
MAGAVVPYLLHVHPSYTFAAVHFVLPVGVALVAPSFAALARLSASGPLLLLSVFGPGALLFAALSAEYVLVRPPANSRGDAARLFVLLASSLIALAVFILVYQTKERSLISGTIVAVAGGLLAWRCLALERADATRQAVFATAAGLALAEVLWALNYWILGPLPGGFVLLACFYVLVGLLRLMLTGAVSSRHVAEYSAVAAIGVLIAVISNRA